jgi:ABC-2 type transport system ATP-binding protein
VSNAVWIKGVTKTFGPKVAVNNLDLEVPEGSLYGFIGPNGAGKTTTIRMIMSIIFPDRGELSVLGRKSAVESKDRIGYLPEERGVYRKMKAGPFLMYIARLKGVDSRGLEGRVKEWMDRVQLADCFRKKCEELSKGMQQKVQFIASVIHSPDLLILDEPFSGLDPMNRRLLRTLIQEQHDAGRTIVFSTHAMYEAEQLCDRLFMINKGVKVLDLSLEEIWARYDPKALVVEPLEAPSPEAVEQWGRWPGVRGVVTANGVVELQLADGADVPEVMRSFTQKLRLRRIELKRPSLDDIFVQLVGGDRESLEGDRSEEAS